MNLLQRKTVLKEANIAFFRTAFCLSAISSKTCFLADEHILSANWWYPLRLFHIVRIPPQASNYGLLSRKNLL